MPREHAFVSFAARTDIRRSTVVCQSECALRGRLHRCTAQVDRFAPESVKSSRRGDDGHIITWQYSMIVKVDVIARQVIGAALDQSDKPINERCL